MYDCLEVYAKKLMDDDEVRSFMNHTTVKQYSARQALSSSILKRGYSAQYLPLKQGRVNAYNLVVVFSWSATTVGIIRQNV